MPKRNVRGDDWIWVDRTRREQEHLGNKAVFAYHGHVFGDAKIRKEINRHVKTLQQQQYSYTPMPARPEGWSMTICTPTPAPTASTSLSQTPNTKRSTDRPPYETYLEHLDRASNLPKHRGVSAKPSTPEKKISDPMELTTTILRDIDVADHVDVNAAVKAFLEDGWTSSDIDDLRLLRSYFDCGGTHYPVSILEGVLFVACARGRIEHVIALLSRGVSPNSRHINGIPCLMIASCHNFESVVQRLVDAGADVDLTDRTGRTSWSRIRKSVRHRIVAFILLGADAKKYNGDILDAAASGDTDEVKSMIDRGADPSYCRDHFEGLPIHSRDRRAKPFLPDGKWTPLHWAAFKGNYELGQFLIGKGAKINAKTREGRTPLDLASNQEIYKLLVANGATFGFFSYGPNSPKENPAARSGHEKELQPKVHQLSEDSVYSVSASMAQMQVDPQETRPRRSFNKGEKAADIGSSPMSWQPTTLAGSPEILKGSPYPISRYLGSSAGSAAVSIKGSSYRSSAHGQASHSLRAILTKNNQGTHKSWATPPMKTPPW